MPKVVHIILTRSLDQVCKQLCMRLTENGDLVAVHLDKKSSDSIPEWLKLNAHIVLVNPNVEVERADFSLVDATLHALNMIRPLVDEGDTINLLSGEDYPVRPLNQFREFLDLNPGLSFLNRNRVPVSGTTYHEGSFNQEFKDRCKWVLADYPTVFYDRINTENYLERPNKPDYLKTRNKSSQTRSQSRLNDVFSKYRAFNRMHNLLTRMKSIPNHDFYAGSAWWTMNEKHVFEILDFVMENPHHPLIKSLMRIKFCDEYFFQSLSVFLKQEGVVNSDLRYLNWRNADMMGRPAMIREADLPLIEKSNAFFCRKVDEVSINLIQEYFGL